MPDGQDPPDRHAADLDLRVVPADELAEAAAAHVAAVVVESVVARGACTLALSGGSTPEGMLRVLGGKQLPWDFVHVVQVDERVAPPGSPERNLTMLHEHLVGRSLPATNLHPMPVTGDLDRAAAAYEAVLREVAGTPPRIDLVHLGLGSDGHTASLVPGDPVTDVTDRDVAPTDPYEGHRRLTLTLPVLARARSLLWLVAGAGKAAALARLLAGDTAIPAGRVRRDTALVLADTEAAR